MNQTCGEVYNEPGQALGRDRERSTDIFIGLLIVLLALLTLAGIYQQTVIQEQRGTIRLLHETTQPRPSKAS